MLIDEIKKLIKIVEESQIDELEVTRWGRRIRIRKNPPSLNSGSADNPGAAATESERKTQGSSVNPVPVEGAEEITEEQAVDESEGVVVKAPMVGTFYRSPAPAAPPFVEEGSKVTVGQTLCIIEAMKLMNELPSEVNGEVSRIFVENGDPIEYGQHLFLIKT
jgi:acetyl-CoA carboxylase biotin carboxyl carrier protein